MARHIEKTATRRICGLSVALNQVVGKRERERETRGSHSWLPQSYTTTVRACWLEVEKMEVKGSDWRRERVVARMAGKGYQRATVGEGET